MKRFVSGMVVAAVAMSLSGVALAVEGSPSPRPSKTPRVERAAEKRDEAKEKAAQKKLEAGEKRKEQLKKFWEKMKRRLEILIRNQSRLAERIGQKLDKMAANGKDVTALRKQLDDAKALIKKANDSLEAADAKIEDILKNNEPKAALEKIRALNKEVVDAIKAAHRALVDVMSGIKGARPSPTPTATPTPTVSS